MLGGVDKYASTVKLSACMVPALADTYISNCGLLTTFGSVEIVDRSANEFIVNIYWVFLVKVGLYSSLILIYEKSFVP